MTEDSQFQQFPTYVQKSSPKFNPFIFVLVLIFVALIAGGGYYYFGMSKKEAAKASPMPNTPKPTLLSEASPSGVLTPVASGTATTTIKVKTSSTPTPTSVLKKESDRSKLRIAVLNGSGVPGAAKEISVDLTDAGYTIASVGNAEEYTYKDITVKITKSKSEYLSLLQKDIKKSMPDAVVTTKIDDKIETDAEVIVGK